MLKEFKEFAMRPTLIEVAIGLVMALALAALVNSLVEHIVMPIVGIIFGEPSFDSVLILTINDSQIRFGSFLTAIVAFLSLAFAVFFFIIKPYKAYLATKPEKSVGDDERWDQAIRSLEKAIKIEGKDVPCRYWSCQILTRYLESGDYRYHRVGINNRQVKTSADGSFVIYASHQNPGIDNWISTQGYPNGHILIPTLLADPLMEATFSVVKLGEVR